jgi:hypothetical protein
MCWKLFSVKKILDALFDDGWCSLCLPESQSGGAGDANPPKASLSQN